MNTCLMLWLVISTSIYFCLLVKKAKYISSAKMKPLKVVTIICRMFKIFPGNKDNNIKAAKDLMRDTTFMLDSQKLEKIKNCLYCLSSFLWVFLFPNLLL